MHECFEEMDAASKSGKADLARIIEDISYSTFSGKRRIYLFDESHRLSKQALDVLLKPMEDSVEGAEEKKLVCIFCTTEPEKMSSTIFSRCAPAFVIRIVEPEVIAQRLAFVCQKENIPYDDDALLTIAEISECHIRDALKDIEGVSMLGKIDRENLARYFHLGANDLALTLLENLGSDLKAAMEAATKIAVEVSPSSAYEKIAEAAMSAYRSHIGVGRPASQWNKAKLEVVSARGEGLLGISYRFAAPPHRPSRNTLVLDVAAAHYALQQGIPPTEMTEVVLSTPTVKPVQRNFVSKVSQEPQTSTSTSINPPANDVQDTRNVSDVAGSTGTDRSNAPGRNVSGVWLDQRAVKPDTPEEEITSNGSGLSPDVFRDLVRYHLRGLSRGNGGSR